MTEPVLATYHRPNIRSQENPMVPTAIVCAPVIALAVVATAKPRSALIFSECPARLQTCVAVKRVDPMSAH